MDMVIKPAVSPSNLNVNQPQISYHKYDSSNSLATNLLHWKSPNAPPTTSWLSDLMSFLSLEKV